MLPTLMLAAMAGCSKHSEETGSDIISIPVRFVEGFGPFESAFASTNIETSDTTGWGKTAIPVSGIPKDWKNVFKSMVWTDGYQFVYQNFHQGKIDSAFYEDLQKSWSWKPDETRLSKKPIRCYIYMVRGTDKSGKVKMMIDTNNNLDFSDESAFEPEMATPKDTLRYYKNTRQVEYDIVQTGQIRQAHLPMAIRYLPHLPKAYQLAYSFPRYAVAEIELDNPNQQLAVNLGFTSPSGQEESRLAFVDKNENYKGRFFNEKGFRIGEFIDLEIGGEKRRFRNLGYNEFSGVLQLKGERVENTTYSTQPGYPLKPFAAKELLSGKMLDLKQYRGKYVMIDFWGTWCKPCVEEIPELLKLYARADTSRIEFISIAGEDSQERVRNFLKKTPMSWPQIVSDSTNKLVESYHIQGYPTTFLLAPEGKIVDVGLRRHRLEAKLLELNCIK